MPLPPLNITSVATPTTSGYSPTSTGDFFSNRTAVPPTPQDLFNANIGVGGNTNSLLLLGGAIFLAFVLLGKIKL
ncbi:MAG: hypothetical protein COB36_11055 [Alphaproteobacteria bacterium]|nr:MAG: hypothetical protein COB36_11055 [Alphaproteobacteria bacterium]